MPASAEPGDLHGREQRRWAVAGSSERCLCRVTTAGRSFCGEAALAACGCGANNDCANVPGAVCVENRPGAFAGCGIACALPCRFPA